MLKHRLQNVVPEEFFFGGPKWKELMEEYPAKVVPHIVITTRDGTVLHVNGLDDLERLFTQSQ
ncbi:MAG: hypothetical protein WC444_01155 [Candidatus Paceibacterota bacterium]